MKQLSLTIFELIYLGNLTGKYMHAVPNVYSELSEHDASESRQAAMDSLLAKGIIEMDFHGEITISQLFNMDGVITSMIASLVGEVILFTLDGAFFAVMFLLLGICLWSISVMIVNYSDEKEKQMKKVAKSK